MGMAKGRRKRRKAQNHVEMQLDEWLSLLLREPLFDLSCKLCDLKGVYVSTLIIII